MRLIQLLDLDIGWGHRLFGFDDQSDLIAGGDGWEVAVDVFGKTWEFQRKLDGLIIIVWWDCWMPNCIFFFWMFFFFQKSVTFFFLSLKPQLCWICFIRFKRCLFASGKRECKYLYIIFIYIQLVIMSFLHEIIGWFEMNFQQRCQGLGDDIALVLG